MHDEHRLDSDTPVRETVFLLVYEHEWTPVARVRSQTPGEADTVTVMNAPLLSSGARESGYVNSRRTQEGNSVRTHVVRC